MFSLCTDDSLFLLCPSSLFSQLHTHSSAFQPNTCLLIVTNQAPWPLNANFPSLHVCVCVCVCVCHLSGSVVVVSSCLDKDLRLRLISMPSLGSRPLFLFSCSLSLGLYGGGGGAAGQGSRCKCVSERKRARVCVCVCAFVRGGFRAGKVPSRCLLWSGDEELAGGEVGLECV